MAKPSMSIPDSVLDELDDQIWELQKAEVMPRGNMRSKVVTAILADWNEQDTEEWLHEHHPELLTGDERKNENAAAMMAD